MKFQRKCLTPNDVIVDGWFNTLDILNEFRKLGFDRRESFVAVVQEKDFEYKDFKMVQKLWAFWQLRLRDEKVNRDLAVILEQLKTE
jgi:hypothetical protein